MKTLLILIFIIAATNTIFAQHENHQTTDTVKAKSKPKSPKMQAMKMIAQNHVHIDYSSPSLRGRAVWNGLVAYDQVWSAGAHKATTIAFSQDVTINNVAVSKGTYGFFAIPSKEKWILILSKTWDMHLADDYTEENDVLRLTVTPEQNAALVESLTYSVSEIADNKGRIMLSWEKLNVSFDFTNQ
jgi:hypothetical protein